MKNIAKLTSYGCYLDCEFTTAKYPNEENHIVGDLAEYVYDLEQQLAEKEKKIKELSEEHFEMFGDMKNYKNLWLEEQRKNKEIRKQVCDEIKEKLKAHSDWANGNFTGWYIPETKIATLIDQIEKGTNEDE